MYLRKTIAFLLSLLLLSGYSCKPKEKTAASASKPKGTKESKLTERERIKYTELFFEATREKIKGNYELAVVHFEDCIRRDPSNPAAYYEVANILVVQGSTVQAQGYAEKAFQLEPSNTWYSNLLGECYIRGRQYEKAITLYEKAVKANPDKVDLYYDLVNAYVYARKYNEAASVYDRLEKRIGITEEVSMQKLRLYKELKNQKKVVDELEKLIRQYPGEAKFYGMLGEYYQELGEKDKAFEAYNKVLKLNPHDPYVHLFLADYYRSIGQNDKSFAELKLAFQNPSLEMETKGKILSSYFSITEKHPELKTQAFDLCAILVEVHPNDAQAHAIYGDFLYRDKNLEKARDEFRKAVSLNKEKYGLWSQLLIIESQLGDYEAMLKDSKEAIELFPNQPIAYLLNGIANLQAKNYKQAAEILEEGKEFVIADKNLLSEFYSNLGEAYHQLGNNNTSDEYFEEALKADPDNVFVLNNYSYYLSLRSEKLERAKEMSRRSNDLEPNNSSYQDTYGWILYQMGDYAGAKEWLQKALDNGGKNNSVILEHFGDVLYKLGDREKALDFWNDAKTKGQGSDLLDRKVTEKKLFE
jgi:tetratricopeptide (TPR) repeat protein